MRPQFDECTGGYDLLMGTEAAPCMVRSVGWLAPVWVALAGVVVILALLFWPISTLGPGDHERERCGNALSLDLDQWRDVPDGEYLERAFRHCTGQRLDRIAQAVALGSATFLTVTILLGRRSRSLGPASRS